MFDQIPLVVSIIALALGTGLVLLECFLPGLGAPGIIGSLCLVFSLFSFWTHIGAYTIIIMLFALALILFAIARFAKKAGSGKSRLVLSASASKEEGFSANGDETELIGAKGAAISDLHPAGIASINNSRYDVVADGEFIDKNSPVEVIAVAGRRITVKKID